MNQISANSVEKRVQELQNTENWGIPLYGGYPKNWTYINNFWWEDLLSNKNSNYQISANLVEKRDQEPQNTENWGVPLYGSYA